VLGLVLLYTIIGGDVEGSWEGFKKWLVSPVVDGVVRAFVLFSMVSVLILSYKVTNTNRCLADYIEANSSSSASDRKVVDDLMVSVTQAKGSGDVKAALTRYLDARATNNKAREEHPFTCS
jgi:hypothetical protein